MNCYEMERLREKADHDEAQALHHAEQIGMEKGIKKGFEKGIEKYMEEGIKKGIKKGIEKVALNLLKSGIPIEQIAQFTGLSQTELKKLIE